MTRQKTGGRIKGTPNRRTLALQEKLSDLNYCPVESLVLVARQAEASGDWPLAVDCAKALMPYAFAKRKAIEHSLEKPDEIFINFKADPSND